LLAIGGRDKSRRKNSIQPHDVVACEQSKLHILMQWIMRSWSLTAELLAEVQAE
jgi:hypothetical protein